MDVDELVRRAWEAVQKSNVPEALQETAFKAAFDALQNQDRPPATINGGPETPGGAAPVAEKATVFSRLAHESGVSEQDIGDVLRLNGEKVEIIPPTKNLGSSKAAQARSVIALVASARSQGMGENPVLAAAVRDEARRKGCYQRSNFSAKSLAPMKGFNAGSNREQIVLSSRWVDEFKDAINQALGRQTSDDETP